MAETVITTAHTAAEAVTSLSCCLWREIRYIFNYNDNLKKLKEKVEELKRKEEAILLEVREAGRNAESIGPDVLDWLKKVDNIKNEATGILDCTNNDLWGCLCCKCPKLLSRYQLSKQALKHTAEAIEYHHMASNFRRIGYRASPGQMPFATPQVFDGFESRMKIQNDVMQALEDDTTTIIGICGMAGIGKTTLVKKIADKVKIAKLFDEVAMAVVSNDSDIGKIQNQLAANLGLKSEESTDRGRAERLYARLKNEENKILIILDDLWQELSLHDIGISPTDHKRLKVLLTSRDREVFNKMKARQFEVEFLSDEESGHLFEETAEISDEANNVKDIAKEVTKECGRLPLAIVIVAKALKSKEDYEWEVALKELKEASVTNPDMNKFVYSRIKLSYNYLAKNSKLLLLLCSLFPEDDNIPLEGLVRYAKGLQLFRNFKMAEVRDMVHTITNGLRSCYLLLVGNDEHCVKLHDVVRDFCLSIASSNEHVYMVRHAGLKEWPEEHNYASYTAISLTFDTTRDLPSELPSGLECPNLEILRLKFQYDTVNIPKDFFNGMNKLKVLEVFYLVSKLPLSLESLVDLQTLCLDGCSLYGGISGISCLRKLQVLSFPYSRLDCFPSEIVQLSNLKSLDLRFQGSSLFPSGVLVSLIKLEELYLGSYFQEWERKGVEAYSAVVSELSSLQNLQTIEFCAYDDCCLEQVLENLRSKELRRFRISRMTCDVGFTGLQFRKVLKLQGVNVDLLSKPTVKKLLGETEDLTLRMEGLANIVINELDVKGFVNLKKLYMVGCDLKYLFDANGSLTSGGTFVNLEELIILKANNLEELFHGNLPEVDRPKSFSRLRKLKLRDMPALTSLFPLSSLNCLRQLQRLSISECPKLETLVSNDEGDEENTRDIELPQLEILELSDLNSFRSLRPELGHKTLFRKVMLPNLKRLQINNVEGIRCIVDDQVQHLAASGSVKLLQSLERVEVRRASSLQVVFDFTGLNIEGANIENLLGHLESLKLTDLPRLKHIWRMLPQGIHAFKNLTSLEVDQCHSLKYLVSPSMATLLVCLKTLELRGCNQMEAIIGREERQILGIESEEESVEGNDGEESTNKIVFPKLRSIDIKDVRNFGMFSSENIDLELPSLDILQVSECPRVDLYHYL